VKARTRLWPEDPRRAKPKGASSGWRTNTLSAARDSREGQSPGTEACLGRSIAFGRREHRQVKRYVGSSGW
jgi:hypothetical protein